jgi:hypothetical protein
VASEKNSTLVMPFPVELLRFFENQAGQPAEQRRRVGGERVGGERERRDDGDGEGDDSDGDDRPPGATAAVPPPGAARDR